MKSHRKKTLEHRVVKFHILIDDEGNEYLPFCNYQNHRGIIKRSYVCEERKCNHFTRLYIPNE